mgnify:CR=1 FL=1
MVTASNQAVLGDVLQVVRMLKDRSVDHVEWDYVEKVLLSEEGSCELMILTEKVSQVEAEPGQSASCCCVESSAVKGDSVVRFDDDRLQKALIYIHQHLDESLGVQRIAREICVSRRWLEYAFRAAFGVTPFQYLRCVRLEMARLRLMSEPNSKVRQIAKKSGFSSARQFTMTFRQYFGYSPSMCRSLEGVSYSQKIGSLAEAC